MKTFSFAIILRMRFDKNENVYARKVYLSDNIHEAILIAHQHINDDWDAKIYKLYNESTPSRWLKDGNKRTCDNCLFEYWANGTEFKYCPDCGSPMKEE